MKFEVLNNSFNFTYLWGKLTLYGEYGPTFVLFYKQKSLSLSYLPSFHCRIPVLAATQTLHRPRTVGHSLSRAELSCAALNRTSPPIRALLLFAVKSSLLCLPSQHIHYALSHSLPPTLCVAFEFHSLCIHALMRFMTYCQATFNY